MAYNALRKKSLFLARSNFNLNTFRSAYIVLVPEIGEGVQKKNTLLHNDGLPEFNNITIEKCVAAIADQISVTDEVIQNIEKSLSTADSDNVPNEKLFENIIDPLEKIGFQLETTWGIAKTLYVANSSVMPTKSYLQIHEKSRRARTKKFNSLPIYNAIKQLKLSSSTATSPSPQSSSSATLNTEQLRLLDKFLLEGKLNGISLDVANKEKLNEIIRKLGEERASFEGKVNVSLKRFSHTIQDYNIVRNMPTTLLKSMVPNDPMALYLKGPWKVTFETDQFNEFMEYCSDRSLRKHLWESKIQIASGVFDRSLETSTHLEKIREYRKQQAQLLGYKNFVEMSMETKMAGSLKNVKLLIDTLNDAGMPNQLNDLNILTKFSHDNGFTENLDVYDIPYWKRKYLKSVHSFDEKLLKDYYSLTNVLSGLFTISEQLFQIKIIERHNVDKWHNDVKFYDIFDLSGSNDTTANSTKPIAGFYLDLYSRQQEKIVTQNSKSGLIVGILNKSKISEYCPLAAVIFNFTADDHQDHHESSKLTIRDIENLYIKFGHCLQHLLTQVNYNELAGLSNIEWDAVQICGHVMSNILFDKNILKIALKHSKTNEPITDQLIHSIDINRKFMASYDLCKELYLSDLDLELHMKNDFWSEIIKNLWSKYNLVPLVNKDHQLCSFKPIFSGEWGAGYFSHIWSKFVAADIYSAFQEVSENPVKLSDVGKRFRDIYFANGGSCHPSVLFRRFRGRDPSPEALIKIYGFDRILSNSTTVVTSSIQEK